MRFLKKNKLKIYLIQTFHGFQSCYRNPYAKFAADRMILTSLNKLSELYLMDGRTYGHTPIVERVCFVKVSKKKLRYK